MEDKMYREFSLYTREFGIDHLTDLVIAKIIENIEIGIDYKEACVLVANNILKRFRNNEIETI